MRKKKTLDEVVEALRKDYGLDIESPFTFRAKGIKAEFDCLVRGYGARSGMIIERHWSKVRPVVDRLTEMGYGYSCFDLRDGPGDVKAMLDDWGKM